MDQATLENGVSQEKLPKPLVMKRSFKAPIEKVFEAWTQAKHVSRWFPPEGFDSPRCEVDLRVGGVMDCDMRGPDGAIYPSRGHFVEIQEPTKLVIASDLLGKDGSVMMQEIDTVLLEQDGDVTHMSVEAKIIFATEEALDAISGMDEGWNQSLGKLERLLN